MHVRRRIFSIVIVVALLIVCFFGNAYTRINLVDSNSDNNQVENDTLTIWYTDAYLEEYLRNAAVVYEERTGIRVIPTCVSGLEYLEAIQKATIDDGYGPDLFIVGNESLEKAYLAGLCAEVEDSSRVLNSTYFPQVSLNAISYSDSKLGYPLMFECSVFLYNRTLLEEVAANSSSEDSSDYGEGSTESEETETETVTTEEGETLTADDILPVSIVGIIEFALKHNLPEGADSFFKWCVSDVLYEYWFTGAYLNVGGPKGDDRDAIDIYNTEAMYGLKVFQDFKQVFSMEIDETKYDEIVKEFEEGKTLFIVADTDIIEELETAKRNEEDGFNYEYGIASIGMLNDTLQSKGLSVTKLVAINGMSEKKSEAEDFAKFLTVDYSDNLYARTGKFACKYQDSYQYPQMEDVVKTYENSVSLPKIVETSNFWVLTEMVYTKAWDGEDVNKLLRDLSGQVKKQIYSVYVEDEYIETPTISEDYIFED